MTVILVKVAIESMDINVFLCQAHIIVANNSLVLFKADLYKEDFERERKDRQNAR